MSEVKACICLAHEIVEKNKLSKDFVKRLEKSYDEFHNNQHNYFILTGGKHRLIKNKSVAKLAYNYLFDKYRLKKEFTLFAEDARDTVGEAIYTKNILNNLKIKNVSIITSDWHLLRAKKIFSQVYGPLINISWNKIDGEKKFFLTEKKNKSYDLFNIWFKKHTSKDNQILIKELKKNHHLYK